MPDPNPSHPTAEEIFHQAKGIAGPEERAAYLDRACEGDAGLRVRVEALLRADADAGSFLDTRSRAHASTHPDPILEKPGQTVGRYKLLQLIGEGGFGAVFLAEQHAPVSRRVALKIIKPGMDSRMVAARFEAERQALALMDHPHIARVFDGGITDAAMGARPYFVMEYVVGDPITRFADAHRLSIERRLNLFTQVCEAVQHAHTKGIIHRDLKPGNVLVSMVDGKPFAKVIDFGIAKSLAARLTEKTLFTEHRQLIGTPEYMSPEQAEGSPDIDTRADVYALGVLLYELLAGSTPFDAQRLRSAAFAELQRIIREEEPLVPSVRLSRGVETLAATAAARQAEPARLSTLVKGELDWIVMKALEKDRARRYETPNQLAEDVRRHLAGEAVVAAPVSRAYRVRKFVKRNKGPVAAGAAIAAALLVGIAGTTWGWREANAANERVASSAALAREGLRSVAIAMGGQPDELLDAMPEALEAARRKRAEIDGLAIRPMEREELELLSLVSVAESSTKRLMEQTDAAEWSAYTANIALAQAAIAAHDYPEARRVSARWTAKHMGWEACFVDRQAKSAAVAILGNWCSASWRSDGSLCVRSHDGQQSHCTASGSGNASSLPDESSTPITANLDRRSQGWLVPRTESLPKTLLRHLPVQRFLDRETPQSGNRTVITPARYRVCLSHDGRTAVLFDTRKQFDTPETLIVELSSGDVVGLARNLGHYFSELAISNDRRWLLSVADDDAGGARILASPFMISRKRVGPSCI